MENTAKLSWRCRRGTLELDVLLQNYLDNGYHHADASEQAQFLDLLALEDDRLQAYLLEDKCPPNEPLSVLIKKVRMSTGQTDT